MNPSTRSVPQTGVLYYPTYDSYRERAGATDADALAGMLRYYRQRQRESADPNIRRCYEDAARAYDDEIMSREYAALDGADDPFFEEAVSEYRPGDMIDFGC